MNPYEQPENKLTYNFLCLLEHLSLSKQIIDYLTDSKLVLHTNPIKKNTGVFGGGESNPDGLIELNLEKGKSVNLFFENKTYRRQLEIKQIQNHIANYCSDDKSYLLIITVKRSDKDLIKKLNTKEKNKIFFKTWDEIATFLKKLTDLENVDYYLISQFCEYGKISGEFDNMDVSFSELLEYSQHKTYLSSSGQKVENKLLRSIENAIMKIDFKKLGIKVTPDDITTSNRWGRFGVDLGYAAKNEYGQYMFWGILYDPSNHGIEFKNNHIELAFFMDSLPKYRSELKKDEKFCKCLERLEKKGFENNLFNKITPNNYKLLFKRIPINKLKQLDEITIRNFILNTIKELKTDSYLFNKLF